MKRKALALAVFVFILGLAVQAGTPIVAPPEAKMDYGFAALDEATMKALLKQGNLSIVRQKADLSLINITSGQLVNAPADLCWKTITDFDNYPKFMPQTPVMTVLEKIDDRHFITQQSIGVKIWRLPSVDITYQMMQEMTPNSRLRFWHVSGDLPGTYGGWDLVPAGQQTMVFYTLYSNLTTLGWGLGGILKAEPDFMAGVNVTTAMMVTKAIKEECERRAKK